MEISSWLVKMSPTEIFFHRDCGIKTTHVGSPEDRKRTEWIVNGWLNGSWSTLTNTLTSGHLQGLANPGGCSWHGGQVSMETRDVLSHCNERPTNNKDIGSVKPVSGMFYLILSTHCIFYFQYIALLILINTDLKRVVWKGRITIKHKWHGVPLQTSCWTGQ